MIVVENWFTVNRLFEKLRRERESSLLFNIICICKSESLPIMLRTASRRDDWIMIRPMISQVLTNKLETKYCQKERPKRGRHLGMVRHNLGFLCLSRKSLQCRTFLSVSTKLSETNQNKLSVNLKSCNKSD